jgi:hypothetical protein
MGALAVLGVLAAFPFLLWHRVLADILSVFRPSLVYLAGDLGPWILIAGGVAFLVPVATSAGLHPESRFYPRARRVYFIWGVVLYLLGCGLAVELYNLWRFSTRG